MTRHRPCPAAPGPLEEYAARFDDLFSRLAQRRGFRGYLAGLPFVMALKPRRGTWAYGPDGHTAVDAARALAWDGPDDPGD